MLGIMESRRAASLEERWRLRLAHRLPQLDVRALRLLALLLITIFDIWIDACLSLFFFSQ